MWSNANIFVGTLYVWKGIISNCCVVFSEKCWFTSFWFGKNLLYQIQFFNRNERGFKISDLSNLQHHYPSKLSKILKLNILINLTPIWLIFICKMASLLLILHHQRRIHSFQIVLSIWFSIESKESLNIFIPHPPLWINSWHN